MTNARRVSLLLALFFIACQAKATAQIPDEILVDGRVEMLFSEPLNAYLARPGNLAKLKPYFAKQRCSGSWRGYKAKWQVRDGRLYLTELDTDPCGDHPKSVPLESLFMFEAKPVLASWYTGPLVVPQGRMVGYVHMGYESSYERYIVFLVKEGVVVDRKESTGISK